MRRIDQTSTRRDPSSHLPCTACLSSPASASPAVVAPARLRPRRRAASYALPAPPLYSICASCVIA
jgi:hypothetical protein